MRGIEKIHVYFLLTLFISFFTQSVFAQAVNKPFYNFKIYTTADGLSSNHVNCTYKDSRGFLWIGTDRGFQRYNGSSFLTFRHLDNNDQSLNSEYIRSINEDSQHNIWFATLDGVTKLTYNNGKLTNYIFGNKEGKKVRLGEVHCIFEDSKGRMWLGTTAAGLYLFNKKTGQFQNYPPASYLDIKENFYWVGSVQETEHNEIVFAVTDGFVTVDQNGLQKHKKVPAPANRQTIYLPCSVLPLLKEYPNEIWLSSLFNGIYRFNRDTETWKHFSAGAKLNSDYVAFAIAWSKDTWLLGADDLCFFNHRTGVFSTAFRSLKINSVYNVSHDDDGNFWISSNIQGLLLLNTSGQLFSATQQIDKLTNNRLYYYDSVQQTLYALNPYNAQTPISWKPATNKVIRYTIPYFLQHPKVVNDFVADDDILYLALHRGMWKLDLKTHRLDSIVYKTGFSNSQAYTFSIVCKSPKNIYFNTSDVDGPFAYNLSKKTVSNLSDPNGGNALPAKHSYGITCSNGILYGFSRNGDSVICYHESNHTISYVIVPPSYYAGRPLTIKSLCVDKNQNLWCSVSNNGLYVYNIPAKKWIRHIAQADGYFATNTSQIVCDDDNNVWCNTSEGLFAFNTANFTFKNYTSKDGLNNESEGGWLSVLANHQLAYSNIKSDSVLFGIINTKPVNTARQLIPVSITNLQVMGQPFLTDTLLDNVQHATLPALHNAFSLNYAGLSLTDGKNLHYSYLLQGTEKNWHNVGNQQSLSYINLTPGTYVLRIKCKSLNGQIVSSERVLYITLLPAWFQTTLFKIFVVLLSISLLFFAVRYYYLQQIKKQQTILEKERALTEERNRIAADMHDDVGAGLSRIRYITSSLQSGKQVSDSDISKIVSLSDEAVEKMNEIIWSLNQGNQQLEELLYYTRSQCSEMISNAGLAFGFNVPEQIPAKTLGWKDCRNIYLLVKEAVNNAIKHAGATSITIDCRIADKLQFSIEDNGKGFNAAEVRKGGNGLANNKKRTERLNAGYELVTAPGRGTKLIFSIPV